MKKHLRHICFGIILAGVIGTCLGAGLSWYLNTNQARIRLSSELNRHMAGTVIIQKHRIFLLKRQLELWNIQVLDPFHKEIAACRYLNARISLTSLLLGKLHILSLQLNTPQIRISVDSDGTSNWTDTVSCSASPSAESEMSFINGIPLIFDTLSITNGCLQYENPSRAIAAEMENIHMHLSADVLSRTGHVDMHITGGYISTPDITAPIGSISLKTILNNGRLDPLELTLKSDALNATISGNISRLFDNPQIHLSAEGDTLLDDLHQYLKTPAPFSGRIHASAIVSGPLHNPEATVTATGETVKAAGYSLNHCRMTAHLKDRTIIMEPVTIPAGKGSVRITADANLSRAFPSGFFLPPEHISAISGHLLLSLAAADMSSIHASSSGIINGYISIHSDETPDHLLAAGLQADIHASHFTWHPAAEPVDAHIHCESRWKDNSLHIHSLNLQSGATRLTASGAWCPRDDAISGELACLSGNLSQSLAPLGIRNASGSLQAQARFSGILNRPEYSIQLKTKQLKIQDIQLGDMDVNAVMNASGALHISSLSIKNQGAEITGKGDIQVKSPLSADTPERFMFAATFHHFEPRRFLRTSEINGVIDGECKLEGAGKSLSGTLRLQGKDISVKAIRLGTISGEFQLLKGQVQIQRLSLLNRHSDAEITGAVQLFEPGSLTLHPAMPFHLTGIGNSLHAEDFLDSLKGEFSLNASLKGDLKQMTGNASLESGLLDTGYQKLKSVRLTAGFDHHRLSISSAHAELASGEPITASGWIASDRTFHLDLAASTLSLNHINALAGKWQVEGKLQLALTGDGSLDHPRITGSAILDPFRWDGNDWGKSEVQIDTVNDLVQIRIQSPILCTATYQIWKKDFTADLKFVHTDLGPLFHTAGIPDMDGRISGTLNSSGNLDRLDALKANASFSHILIEARHVPLVEGHNLQLVFQDDAIVFPQNRMTLLHEGSVILTGNVHPGHSVALDLTANLPLHAAGAFQNALTGMKGNLTASARIQGSWNHPDMEASVDIQQAGLPLYATTQQIHDVNGRIHITPQAIAVEHFEGGLDNGHFRLTGKALLNAWQIHGMDFHLIGTSLPVSVPDALDMRLDTDLTLQGNPQSAAIQGNIVLVEGSYYKDVDLNPLKALITRDRSFQTHSDIIFPAALQNIHLDIRIPPRNQFIWDNNLAQLRLSPDMRITGTLQHPVIHGRTRIDSGTLQYQNNTFTVKRGFIDFINPYTLESLLDIQSQTSIRNWTVFLDVSGPSNQLNLKLSSSPFLDDSDLLSLLIMGKTARTSLSTTTGQTSSSQKMLADMLSASVGSDLKKISGLDILDVDTTGQTRYVNDDPLKVTLGKVISPQITLKYTVENRQGETVQTAIADYMLVENLLLSGFQDNQGIFGGEFKYRHEFR
jgi:autotransporter translocation and assembly factor TamB